MITTGNASNAARGRRSPGGSRAISASTTAIGTPISTTTSIEALDDPMEVRTTNATVAIPRTAP